MKLTANERKFLAAVRDNQSIYEFVSMHGISWAVERGLVTLHKAYPHVLEAYITPAGRAALEVDK